jgi:hypothetical protein
MLLQVADLLMRGIPGNFGRQTPWFAGPNVAQEIFSMLHAASRRADAEFKPRKKTATIAVEYSGIRHRLSGCRNGQSRRAAKTGDLLFGDSFQFRQMSLGTLRDAASLDRNACDLSSRRLSTQKGSPSRGRIVTEWRHAAPTCNDDIRA